MAGGTFFYYIDALNVYYDALKGHIEKAIVITNDSDLCEPIRLAVGEGIPVGIVNPHRSAPRTANSPP